jgi:hypothetical protein
MTAKFLRDASLVPALGDLLDRTWHPYLRHARDLVARAAPRGGRRRALHAAIELALGFYTWRTLVRDAGLSTAEAIDVAVGAVLAADAPR